MIDSQNKVIDSDIICDNLHLDNDCNLYFAAFLDSFSFDSFKMVKDDLVSPNHGKKLHFKSHQDLLQFAIKNKKITIQGNLQSFTFSDGTNEYPFEIFYNHYRSYQGPGQPSGAYIFRPDEITKEGSIRYGVPYFAKVFEHKNLIQISIYGDKFESHLKFYADATVLENAIEVETFLKAIDVSDQIGREVTLNIQTEIKNGGLFKTDSNGLEMQTRKLNHRDTWTLNNTEPISGNYYPVNSIISIQDKKSKLR